MAAPKRSWKRFIPFYTSLSRAVGLQKGMLVFGLVITGFFLLLAIFAPIIAPFGYADLRGDEGMFGSHIVPGADHIFGTTMGGYDVLSRVIWGTRTALFTIVIAVLLSSIIGIALGLVSGYFGGWPDRIMVAMADGIYAFPSLLLAILMAIVISGGQSSLWGGILAAAIAITVVFIPQYYRLVRAETIRVKAEAFVDSSKVIGASNGRIMIFHILRNSTRTLPLVLTLNASEAILTLAALGFLGFGIEPTAAAEWGYDLNKSIAGVTSGIWWTSVFPGMCIVFAVLGITLIGESLNDLADPRLRLRRAATLGADEVGGADIRGIKKAEELVVEGVASEGARSDGLSDGALPQSGSASSSSSPSSSSTEDGKATS